MLKHTPLQPSSVARALLPLTVRRLTLERGQARLLDDIDLTIAGPGITLIMGPNGAGKSLLIRVLHGLEAPTTGTVSWGGQEMTARIRKQQAMVFQRPVLLRRSVAANIDFVLALDQQSPGGLRSAILRRVALANHERTPARLLSGGEQQRLALARALASRPRVLFLDEPTASLDPMSTAIIEDIVREESDAGTKIIFVTHDVSQAKRLGDDVVFLHHGQVAEVGDAAQLFNAPRSAAVRDYLAGRLLLD